jgi:putative ATP-dependent endonuclease of the OLD family
LRGMDDYWVSKNMRSFAYQGIALLDAGGASKIRGIAEDLTKLAYEAAVFADSDSQDFDDADAEALRSLGIPVTLWSDSFSIERRVFADVTWEAVVASVELAFDLHGQAAIVGQVQAQFGSGFNRDCSKWIDVPELRMAIGIAAKKCSWFKNIAKGKRWAMRVSPYLDDPSMKSKDLTTKLAATRGWIDRA